MIETFLYLGKLFSVSYIDCLQTVFPLTPQYDVKLPSLVISSRVGEPETDPSTSKKAVKYISQMFKIPYFAQ